MSLCDDCVKQDVCGEEDIDEEAMVFCAHRLTVSSDKFKELYLKAAKQRSKFELELQIQLHECENNIHRFEELLNAEKARYESLKAILEDDGTLAKNEEKEKLYSDERRDAGLLDSE